MFTSRRVHLLREVQFPSVAGRSRARAVYVNVMQLGEFNFFVKKLGMKIKILRILLSVIFLVSGGAKLVGLAFEIAAFEKWGYPLWFMYFIGAIEISGAIGLLVQRLSALAGGCLALMMIGAVATHVIHAEWGTMVVASIILALAATHAWLGRDEIQSLAGRR